MNLQPDELIYKLHKGEPLANVMLVVGEEEYYRSQILAALPDYIFAGVDVADREITTFDKDTNLHELESVINSYPFFSGKSLVFLRDEKLLGAKQESEAKKTQLEKLLKIIADVPEYCTFVISVLKLDKRGKLYKELAKSALVCECESIKPANLSAWLKAQAQEAGGSFDTEAMATIMEYLAPVDKAPLQLLQQEIAKLAIYAGERKRWTKEDVETMFSDLPEVSQFALLNAIAERKLLDVLELLAAERKKGTPILKLCGFIMFEVRRLLRMKEFLEAGYPHSQIASELKMSPYAVKKVAQQCQKFSLSSLKIALEDLAQLNIGIRQGGRQYELLEEIFVKLLR